MFLSPLLVLSVAGMSLIMHVCMGVCILTLFYLYHFLTLLVSYHLFSDHLLLIDFLIIHLNKVLVAAQNFAGVLLSLSLTKCGRWT